MDNAYLIYDQVVIEMCVQKCQLNYSIYGYALAKESDGYCVLQMPTQPFNFNACLRVKLIWTNKG